MTSKVIDMHIRRASCSGFFMDLKSGRERAALTFCPSTRRLVLHSRTPLGDFLLRNEDQLRKLLHNKRPESFYPGFVLTFVLFDQKDMEAFSDKNRLLVIDKRGGRNESYAVEKGLEPITRLYTDGSFRENGAGGIAHIIEFPDGTCLTDHRACKAATSTLTELYAAMEGLERLRDREAVRIVTDSQYVRKGLTEWIRNWKLNDWTTANGTRVKNVEDWKRFDRLTDGKYIEIQWVKSHRDHLQNTLCDRLAKSAAFF